VLFINGPSGLLGRNMPAEAAEALFRDQDVIGAGAIFPFAKAVVGDGGATVTGRSPYASGCKHATNFIMMCHLHDGDVPRMTPFGPDLRIAAMPASDIKIVDTWDVSGLVATGSHDIVADGVFVPDAYLVPLMGVPNRFYDGPNYRLPFMTLFGWTISAVALGIAQHAIDATRELAGTKVPAGTMPGQGGLRDRPVFQLHLADAEALVRSARAWIYQSLSHLWDLAQASQPADLDDRLDMQLAVGNAVRSARLAVEEMYLACGGTANYRSSPLQRCQRDIHAVSQHILTSPNTWQGNGAMLAGFPPAQPFILL
jgi:alkylation response protein AidB-like acyl-CoA dehydrogenase